MLFFYKKLLVILINFIIVTLWHWIYWNMEISLDIKGYNRAVLIDLNGFGRIDHDLLIMKLHAYIFDNL